MGLLYGFSIFSYDITNIDLSSGYWGTNDKAAIYGCHSRAQWLEPLAGIRVNLYKGLKMGFSVRYKVLLKAKNDETTRPWIIPGMGKRGGGFDFTYSLYSSNSDQEKETQCGHGKIIFISLFVGRYGREVCGILKDVRAEIYFRPHIFQYLSYELIFDCLFCGVAVWI